MQKRAFTLLKILVGITFFVPLAVFPSGFVLQNFIFPFILPKVILFQSLVLLMLIPVVFLLAREYKKHKPSFHALHVVVLISVLSLLLSTVVSVDRHLSLWDSQERMMGVFTLLHYILYYFILSSFFKEEKEWKQFQWLFLFSGVLVTLVGIVQKFNPDYLLGAGEWRVASTLGNSIYVGGFGLFLFYLGYLRGRQEIESWKKYSAWGCAFLGLIALFLSGTRGTTLALIGSLFVLCGVYFVLVSTPKIRRTLLTLLGGIVLLLGIGYTFRTSNFLQENPLIGRLVNTSFSESGVGTRLLIWRMAWDAWQEKPFFGWGVNTFYYASNSYYDPKVLLVTPTETWFDNAHNVVMNTLATQGIVGFLSYLALFVVAIAVLIRGYRQKRIDVHVLAVGAAFLTGHFIHNLFVFENATSYLYLYFFLAFITFCTREPKEEKILVRPVPFWLIPVTLVAVFSLLYCTNVTIARANYLTFQAMRHAANGRLEQGLQEYQKAQTLGSPYQSDLRISFTHVGSDMIQKAYNQGQRTSVLQDFATFLVEEQKKNHEERPLDIRTDIRLAQMFLLSYYLNPQPELLVEAENLLLEAKKISPKRQEINFILAIVKTLQKKPEEGIALHREAVEWEPRAGEAWIKLALAYYRLMGDTQKTLQTFEEAEQRGAVFAPYHRQIMQEFKAAAASL